jgi:hypothetical protein
MLLTTTKKELTNKPLTFTAEEAGANVYFRKSGTSSDLNTSGIQYRLNEADGWTPYTINEKIILENEGDYVQFQNTNETFSLNSNNYITAFFSKKIKASGNVQSLLNYSDSCPAYCFYNLFNNNYYITAAPELPATTLFSNCYARMFYGCGRLTKAPELPATTLAEKCYNNMFERCTSLTTAPELPATTLSRYCYYRMFYGCTGLTSAPELPATTLMNSCYDNMFNGCTSLTAAPELPATSLAAMCYQRMFSGCSSLSEVKVHFTDWNESNSTDTWLSDTNAEGTFICPTALPVERGTTYIPEGWTVVNF